MNRHEIEATYFRTLEAAAQQRDDCLVVARHRRDAAASEREIDAIDREIADVWREYDSAVGAAAVACARSAAQATGQEG